MRRRLAALQTRASERRIGEQLIAALARPSAAVREDAQLNRHIDLLRQRIPVVARERITRLDTLASGAEAQVYVNHPSHPDAVYKLLSTDEGRLAGGLIAGRLARDPHGGIRIVGQMIPTVLDLFERISLANEHGGLVFTEIAAVTPDGALILKQPYIRNAHHTDWIEVQMRLITDVGLRPASLDDQVAVARVGEQLVLFEDLHEGNVLQLPTGELFIVDSPARVLDADEVRLVLENLLPAPPASP